MKNDYPIYLAHMPQWNISQPPMGISYIGAYLKSKGHEVFLSDFSIELFSALPEQMKYIMDAGDYHINWIHEESYRKEVYPKIEFYLYLWLKKILSKKPKIVGFSTLSTNRWAAIDMARLIKNHDPSIKIIIGGPFVTRYEGAPYVICEDAVDFVIPDEGEETCNELVEYIKAGNTNYHEIHGLMYKNSDGEIIDNGPRKQIEDINLIPFPIYEMFPLEKYKSIAIPILGSRGCIFKCTFCSETVLWKRFRFRSAENLVSEFKHHLKHFKNNYFYIVDSLINGNIKELQRMCELILKEDLKICWGGKASIRNQMSPELLQLMAKAGCVNVEYGIESGSPKVIRDMRKSFNVKLAKQVIKDTHEAGIKVGTFWLVGFPTEAEEDYNNTKNFLIEMQDSIHTVIPGFGMGIQPGSDIYLNQEKYGIYWGEDGNWYTDVSDPETRAKRVKEFREFCHTLNVNVS